MTHSQQPKVAVSVEEVSSRVSPRQLFLPSATERKKIRCIISGDEKDPNDTAEHAVINISILFIKKTTKKTT